ncbi:hypothetical protein PHYPSEUDO_000420 [Phytophthora pseudosyringae]|uniref:Uncharacterized protein n=1 Tax=Phytophthora pseudosyringae TaxID=221518 RepID=A0A8T1VXU4_9STRA|nr:hypothetical protein PHYPSEUDO_000420 [Phytophthora pseudosyringae]
MATRGKPSVFAAFNQLREDFDSDDGSADERQQERKEKQKQKKNDTAQLKDLAFVSVSKPKKSKSKKGKAAANAQLQSPAGSPVEDAPAANGGSQETQEAVEPKRSLADLIKAAPQPQKTAAEPNGVEKMPQPAAPPPQQQPKKKVASPPKQKQQQQQQQQQQQSAASTAAPAAAAPPAASAPQSSSETELGAVYTPSHITITRVDGQMKRTVAVTEVMDQLLRYTQQNAQLLMVQEQLGVRRRPLT